MLKLPAVGRTGHLMAKHFPLCLLSALTLLLGGTVADAADPVHGERVFKVCAPCHAIDSDTNKIGPHLKGVFGRRAGSVEEFRYSGAMKEAGEKGLVWDDAALADFLSSPKNKVPGTSMRFWGLWFQSEIDDLVAYLKANS
jgi:cytochrome c